ncbi:Cytochrome c biogenesis ATP-binding export protein CcmA [Methylobacterium adhaesivum]|uniref:Heme ABC exporter ATP-binding protein CcmA n=1 Tax=Methylobacterium adhaesivum TaxID=333297 RepID=A0ABT8BAQ2_9HYPH|nr:heme ABC exporter ATP-binding protein CcmA [Methylobacterium adhaesivum]MDN3589097.1 heme ABC exporter ATP-binding protein CcmA [Methylobacterium adhaesivum]GJD31983.1 Cytochrome c biogenesis ATP-binding export protein CcmA [Methylobacterium adhaesivum]
MRLTAQDLAVRRSGRRIFSGVSFALEAGEALMVTGRNGAGKSTLLAVLAGRLKPEAGTLTAHDVGEATLPECLHVVGHRDGLKSPLTAEENLAFARDLLGAPTASPRAALEELGLGHALKLPVAFLSAGQRRRVALARLLVCRRPLWLLDEPTAALDVASQGVLAGMMARHRATGGLVIAATHQALGLDGARELRIEPTGPEAPVSRDASSQDAVVGDVWW